jgi:multiple sugar transport system permease protein
MLDKGIAPTKVVGRLRVKWNVHRRRILLSRVSRLIWSVYRTLFIIGMSYIILFPLLKALLGAFRTPGDYMDPSVVWIPRHVTLDNIKSMAALMVQPFKNTIRIEVVSTVLQVLSSCVVGYGFARFKFKGRGLLFGLVLFTIIVPPETVSIPSYVQFRFFQPLGFGPTINILHTAWTIYLPAIFGVGFRSGLFIYIFRQFFKGMPAELEDAARMDGCGTFQTFLRIMLPNAVPPLLTVFLFSVVWNWNEYLFAGMYLGQENKTLATWLYNGTSTGLPAENPGQYVQNYAAALLFILPLLLMFIVAQKYFIESAERTGIKG